MTGPQMAGNALDWLKRPIAHRGLHDATRGIIENSASAIEAAIAKTYAIEVDLQCARDRVPVVFHDERLDRLTDANGAVADHDVRELCAMPLRGSADRILSLPELLELVDGRVPLIIEVKSNWGRDPRYETNIARMLRPYNGAVAVMSFDPHLVGAFRRLFPALPRGLVSERFDIEHRHGQSKLRRFAMRHLLTSVIARPNFIAYDVRGLPALASSIARDVFGLPLLTWTVRSETDKETARRYADAMIFEGVEP
jgi:glycerophosphoryl diester phosphodiesterase